MVAASADSFELTVDGAVVLVADEGLTLLDVLREQLGVRSVKDGCSPQGQCGCCTVLVDGQARVACVTPARRVQGRAITTLEGLDADVRDGWARAFAATGGSQCGFCTPGIICRFAGLHAKGADHDDRGVAARALAAHLCRCTGWQPIVDAWVAYPSLKARARRCDDLGTPVRLRGPRQTCGPRIEGRMHRQSTGPHVSLRGLAASPTTRPRPALSWLCGPVEDCAAADEHGWVVAETARRGAKTRRARFRAGAPRPAGSRRLEVPRKGTGPSLCAPAGPSPATWRPTRPGASPDGEPASPLGNGGAFGGKLHSPVAEAARRLADRHGRPVRVLWSRPDTVELGPKRPPIAAGVRPDGTGEIVVARTPGALLP